MRFTNVLCQINYIRHVRRIWKRQGRLQAEELKIPQEILEMGVPIKDSREILLETKLFPQQLEVKKKPLFPLPPSVLQQEEWFYIMHSKTKVSESENQTLALTKTIPYKGLPAELNALIGKDSLPNQDEMVQNSLLQSHVWDGDQHKLPKFVDILNPGWNFKRSYGTRHKKKVSALLEKLMYLCDFATGKYVGCLRQNRLIDAMSDLTIERNGACVTFNMPSDFVISSDEPLKRFASASLVAETENQEVPSIFPLKSTLDLDKVEEKSFCTPLQTYNRHIHTLFIAQKSYGYWFPHQVLARAIATCFAFSAKEAQMKYGVNVGKLPEPIAIQCVYMDIKSFNFLTYQLNTLELDTNDGIKNQVWIDEPLALYENVSESNLITNYNPEVFPKLLAFSLNGLHPSTV